MGGVYTPVAFVGPACPSASSGCAWMALEEEEACTRRCIAELYAALLELLVQYSWEGGLLSAPPSVCNAVPSGGPINLCTAPPPPGRLPCAAPWGTFSSPPPPTEGSVGSTEGWGYTSPPPLPLPCTPTHPAPQTQGQGTRDGAVRPPPLLRGARPQVVAHSTVGGKGGALPVATAAGLSSSKGAHSVARARLVVPRVLSWGEGDHNHPLPARLKMGRPANAAACQGAGRTGAGLVRPAPGWWRRRDHNGARIGLNPWQSGLRCKCRHIKGGSTAPVLAHGRASGEVIDRGGMSFRRALTHRGARGGIGQATGRL